MKRKSKYLGNLFGNWKCTHVGIANVQGKKAKWAGHRNYYYIFERVTSDKVCEKMVRLNSSEAAKVYQGLTTVEDIAQKRGKTGKFARKISYHFIDRI